ncbi:phytanoyl-CoA dioxygenase family protein [Pricia sp.]|uniref:phytanoyl-CoA dioxygenase family protein n=1 Tax=Pricia sp. TaxID=2268138 RepID=UPI0035938F04
MDYKHSFILHGKISSDNIDYYKNFGYLIAPDFISQNEIDELKQETAQIFKGNRGKIEGLAKVGKQDSNTDVLKKYVAIHFPHKISPVIRKYLTHEKVADILSKIVSPNVKAMQSMLFVKAPGKAGQSWHQDEYFIPTRDRSLIGAWIAIDDATIENGCLWVIPGSQNPGSINKRIKNESKEYADLETLDVSGFEKEDFVPVEVRSGSVVFFNGYLFHSSQKNKTKDRFRTALVNHYMSAESMLPWDQDGKLPATEDLRDIVMVCGTDPYAHKGTIDVNRPYLRQDKTKSKLDGA